MRFYFRSHAFTCGVDLHVRALYLCVLDGSGQIVLHRNLPCKPGAVLEALAPFRDDLVVGCECIFCWYWLADLCEDE
ncbi:MAG: IS110 family transposase, partial [Thermoanaerobaculia bacterium]|nr:IS110 family transposase [Thermoanaerobaculia bacterium]